MKIQYIGAIILLLLVSCSKSGNKSTPPPPPPPPPPPVVCEWNPDLFEGDADCRPECPWDSELLAGDEDCVECIVTLQWIAPTHYEDCDLEEGFFYQCGEPLPEGYLTRFNAFTHIDKEEQPIVEIEIQDPYIVVWEIRDVREDVLHFNMTASGYDPGNPPEPNPDTGVIPVETSRLSNWTTKTCD